MALRVKRSQHHLLAAIENNRLEGPIRMYNIVDICTKKVPYQGLYTKKILSLGLLSSKFGSVKVMHLFRPWPCTLPRNCQNWPRKCQNWPLQKRTSENSLWICLVLRPELSSWTYTFVSNMNIMLWFRFHANILVAHKKIEISLINNVV